MNGGQTAVLTNNEQISRRRANERDETYSGKRRRNGEPDFDRWRGIKKWGAVAAALPAVGTVIFTINNAYFQSDAEAQSAHAAIMADQSALAVSITKERERNDQQDAILGRITGTLDRQEILALKAERRALKAEIEATRRGDARRERLETQYEAVDEDLRRRGVQ